jgi:hypothetical protein
MTWGGSGADGARRRRMVASILGGGKEGNGNRDGDE